MPYLKGSSGTFCSVINCKNSGRRLHDWKVAECSEHVGLNHEDCPCLVPYGFHRFPKDLVKRQEWIANIKRKDFNPPKYTFVCSIHFIDKRPTLQNPNPVLNLGYKSTENVSYLYGTDVEAARIQLKGQAYLKKDTLFQRLESLKRGIFEVYARCKALKKTFCPKFPWGLNIIIRATSSL